MLVISSLSSYCLVMGTTCMLILPDPHNLSLSRSYLESPPSNSSLMESPYSRLPEYIDAKPFDSVATIFLPSRHFLPIRAWQKHSYPVTEQAGYFTTIAHLLADPASFHKRRVLVRGTVTQPELHVDLTSLFIDFVFVLKDGTTSLIVFGQHDRTKGDIQIQLGRYVEVSGIFWEIRESHGSSLTNNLEALSVTFFPPLQPDET